MATRTKIEISPALVRSISGLDDLARVFFPDNSNHRRTFLAVWLGIKYADAQFLPSSVDLTRQYGVSSRSLEIVRAKMKRLGLIKRVSHFNPAFGSRSGWVFSPRFRHSLSSLAEAVGDAALPSGRAVDRQKDEDAVRYA
jgi:hypothetical protein